MRFAGLFLLSFFTVLAVGATPVHAEKSKNFAGPSRADSSAHQASGSSNAARTWLSYYREEQKSVSYPAIAKFIQTHPDFPAMYRLREVAEKAMPSSLSDREYLDWFSVHPPETAFGMKMYAGALTRAGQKDKAYKEINEWWKSETLTPSDQSKAYMAFATLIDRKSHVIRLRQQIYRSQYTNARAVAEALGSAYQALAEARISLRSGKGNVDALVSRVPASLQTDEGLLFDRLRWRRKADNDAGAIELLNKQPPFEELYDPDEWGKERSILVRRLFEEGKYSQAYSLAANNKLKEGVGFATNEWMAGWLALNFVDKKWEAFQHFEKLYHNVGTPISKSRAAYWAGLASDRLGHPDIAAKWYDVAAKHSTTFYGQLASEKLGRPDKIINPSVGASNLKNGSLADAARWLKRNGYKAEAGLFLTRLIDEAQTVQDYTAVAALSEDLSMPQYGIKSAQECEKETGTMLVGYAFPKIEKYMGGTDVEWALVHALVRQESRYDTEAISSAGARGLMQLMPGTAKEVARKAGLSHNTSWLTSKPAHNVALGTRYLEKLLVKYNGNYAMALAAYNAGPARVDRWTQEIGDPRNPKVDLINWIEKIPIYETRNYVQRVLEGVYVYRQTLANNRHRPSDGITHLASQ